MSADAYVCNRHLLTISMTKHIVLRKINTCLILNYKHIAHVAYVHTILGEHTS